MPQRGIQQHPGKEQHQKQHRPITPAEDQKCADRYPGREPDGGDPADGRIHIQRDIAGKKIERAPEQ